MFEVSVKCPLDIVGKQCHVTNSSWTSSQFEKGGLSVCQWSVFYYTLPKIALTISQIAITADSFHVFLVVTQCDHKLCLIKFLSSSKSHNYITKYLAYHTYKICFLGSTMEYHIMVYDFSAISNGCTIVL